MLILSLAMRANHLLKTELSKSELFVMLFFTAIHLVFFYIRVQFCARLYFLFIDGLLFEILFDVG